MMRGSARNASKRSASFSGSRNDSRPCPVRGDDLHLTGHDAPCTMKSANGRRAFPILTTLFASLARLCDTAFGVRRNFGSATRFRHQGLPLHGVGGGRCAGPRPWPTARFEMGPVGLSGLKSGSVSAPVPGPAIASPDQISGRQAGPGRPVVQRSGAYVCARRAARGWDPPTRRETLATIADTGAVSDIVARGMSASLCRRASASRPSGVIASSSRVRSGATGAPSVRAVSRDRGHGVPADRLQQGAGLWAPGQAAARAGGPGGVKRLVRQVGVVGVIGVSLRLVGYGASQLEAGLAVVRLAVDRVATGRWGRPGASLTTSTGQARQP